MLMGRLKSINVAWSSVVIYIIHPLVRHFCGNSSTLRLLLAMCNSLDLQYSSADIRTAFLHPSRSTEPDHALYIRRPLGASDADITSG